ncbi:MAG: hypothetical protein OEV94_10000 [Deltaproteobacteria bacterium]|nr:hypothetical protein [Deltaproteobacteria bacterium]MDH4122023.1 hypothetical protein [Deltaproteobacteria bacterium]
MNITHFHFQPYSLQVHPPLPTARGEVTHRQGFWIRVARDSLMGWGEAAPWPELGTETLAHCQALLESWQRQAERAEKRGIPGKELLAQALACPAARHGLDMALADLAAQQAGLPLADWLLNQPQGSEDAQEDREAREARDMATPWPNAEQQKARLEAKDRVAVNGLIGALEAEEAAQQAQALVGQGFHTLKIKLRGGQEHQASDLARVRAVAERVCLPAANPARLRLDVNGAWNLPQAKAMMDQIVLQGQAMPRPKDAVKEGNREESARKEGDIKEGDGKEFLKYLEYVEQPLPPGDPGWAELAQGSPLPLALDESIRRPEDLAWVLETFQRPGFAQPLLVLKPMVLGGILPAWELARQALAVGLDVVVTTTLEGPLARLGALHLAAAVEGWKAEQSKQDHRPRQSRAHGLAHGHLLSEELPEGWTQAPTPHQGEMRLPHQHGKRLSGLGRA